MAHLYKPGRGEPWRPVELMVGSRTGRRYVRETGRLFNGIAVAKGKLAVGYPPAKVNVLAVEMAYRDYTRRRSDVAAQFGISLRYLQKLAKVYDWPRCSSGAPRAVPGSVRSQPADVRKAYDVLRRFYGREHALATLGLSVTA